ncbi:hypothetical protein GGR56DRAFT_147751 [Xylariaceae sp. FL0804]|nr:hypothetical protein GGR56DRAFT_147751 [Xylariaceae sp. FL0804]
MGSTKSADTTSAKKPSAKTSSAKTSSADTSSVNTSSANTSSANTSSANTSSANTSSANTSSADTSSADTSSADTTSADTCPFCLEAMEEPRKTFRLNCGYMLHTIEPADWVRTFLDRTTGPSCPVCRAGVDAETSFRILFKSLLIKGACS